MRKCLAFLLALSMVLAVPAFAVSADSQAVTINSVKQADLTADVISLDMEIKNASEKNILVSVIKSGYKMEQAVEDKSIAAYVGYISAKDDKIEFSFDMKGKDEGYYSCIVTIGSEGYDQKEFYYTDGGAFKTAYETLTSGCSPENLEAFLNSYAKSLDGLENFAPYTAVKGEDEFYKLLNSFAEDFEDKQYSPEDFCSLTRTAAVVSCFNLSKKDAAVKNETELYAKELGLDTLGGDFDAYGIYGENLSVYGMKNVVESLYGRDFDTVEELQERFCESVFVQYITNNKKGGPGHIQSFLEKGYYEVDLSNYSSSSDVRSAINTSLIGADITDITQLQDMLDEKEPEDDDNDRKGSSSKRGGGGGGASGNVSISSEYAEQQRIEGEAKVQAEAEKKSFNDMDGYDWAEEAVAVLHELGIVSGNGDGGFEPQRSITREEFVKILLMCTGVDIVNAGEAFDDVPEGHWAYTYVVTARELGITEGSGDNMFNAGTEITREDCAVMIYRLLCLEPEVPETVFADDADISDYARDAVYTLVSRGVINGTDENKFAPKKNCSRAEAAVMLYRLYKTIGG